jgi:hypothetical protein
VLRNAVLALGAAATLLPTSGRSLHAIDAISFAGGLAMLVLIFQALQALAVPWASHGAREGVR